MFLDPFILRRYIVSIDSYPSLCSIMNQELPRKHATDFYNFVYFIVPFSEGKQPERPRADGDSASEIANGNPGYSFSEKNADRLTGRPLRVGHSSIPSLAHVGESPYAARCIVVKSGKTERGLCLNCCLHAVVQFDHLGAGLAVEHGRDSR